jgi:hypothetical protein
MMGSSQQEEVATMRKSFGALLALIGGTAVVFAVVLLVVGIACSFSDNEDISGYMSGIALSGALLLGVVGTPILVGGVVLLRSGKWNDDSSRGASEVGQSKNWICQNCGCRVADGSKTCKWCGADLK